MLAGRMKCVCFFSGLFVLLPAAGWYQSPVIVERTQTIFIELNSTDRPQLIELEVPWWTHYALGSAHSCHLMNISVDECLKKVVPKILRAVDDAVPQWVSLDAWRSIREAEETLGIWAESFYTKAGVTEKDWEETHKYGNLTAYLLPERNRGTIPAASNIFEFLWDKEVMMNVTKAVTHLVWDGRYGKSYSISRQVLETTHYLIPSLLILEWSRMNHIEGDNSYKAVVTLEAMLASGRHSREFCIRAHLMLASVYERAGRFEEAFRHAAAGNALARAAQGPPARAAAAAFHWYARELMAVLTPENFAALGRRVAAYRLPPGPFVPVFLVGAPRSGSTLAEAALARHPRVAPAGEAPCLQDLGPTLKFQDELASQFTRIEELFLRKGHVLEMREKYFSCIFRHVHFEEGSQVTHVTDKWLQNFRLIGFSQLLFPEAKFVYCTREPLDVATSIFFVNFNRYKILRWFEFDFHETLKYIKLVWDAMHYWQDKLGISFHSMLYEETVQEFERTVNNLVDFLELGATSEDFSAKDFYLSVSNVKTASHSQVRRALYTSSLNRWQKYSCQMLEFLLGGNHELLAPSSFVDYDTMSTNKASAVTNDKQWRELFADLNISDDDDGIASFLANNIRNVTQIARCSC